ncbi:hypothetical protein F2Q70_00032263 [Brassica cretica]|uniref:Major facilitator superfamily (MFS) profile domain-containing protein n=1 Tax=Brassica cretica TaxID=69181 RepID=A0A8S9FJS5_BRACR|nr:hypothetical protein F2Q70_00032263 [Brassica cretica]
MMANGDSRVSITKDQDENMTEDDGFIQARGSRRGAQALPRSSTGMTGKSSKGETDKSNSEMKETKKIVLSNKYGSLDIDRKMGEVGDDVSLGEEDRESQKMNIKDNKGKGVLQEKESIVFGGTKSVPSGSKWETKERWMGNKKTMEGARGKLKKINNRPVRGLIFGPTKGEINLSESGKRLRVENNNVGRQGGAFRDNMEKAKAVPKTPQLCDEELENPRDGKSISSMVKDVATLVTDDVGHSTVKLSISPIGMDIAFHVPCSDQILASSIAFCTWIISREEIRQGTMLLEMERLKAGDIPKAMIGLILVDKWGRRPLLLTSACGMTITCMLLGLAFALQKMQLLPELTPVFTFICVTLYIAAYAIGVGGLPWVIMSEIFPINIKVTAGSLVTLASWSSSSIVTYAFNFLFEWSTQGTFYIFGAIGGGALLFIWLLVPETKGLSLEEIQISLTGQPDEISHM